MCIIWMLVIKMSRIFTDENKTWQFDFTNAIWATDKLHLLYEDVADGVLCDVDFLVEDEYNIYLVECKNSNIKNVSQPQCHRPLEPDSLRKIARKFYDSLLYLQSIGKCGQKRNVYVYVLEAKSGDSVTRKSVKNRLKRRLPFKLQKNPEFRYELISDLQVCSLDEWNQLHPTFPALRLDAR